MVDDVYIKHLESENRILKREVRRLSQLRHQDLTQHIPKHSSHSNQTNPNIMCKFLNYLKDEDNNMTYGFLPNHAVKLKPFKELFFEWAQKNVDESAFNRLNWDEEVGCFEGFGLSIQGNKIMGLCPGISSWY